MLLNKGIVESIPGEDIMRRQRLGGDEDSVSNVYRKTEDPVPAFSRHLGSYKFSDVSFEWSREEGKSGETNDIDTILHRCREVPHGSPSCNEPLL